MREMKNRSNLLVPISVAGEWWGHIGIDDCKAVRHWTSVEIDTLGTLAEVIGAVITRERTQASLQKSEERFRAVSETAQDAVIMWMRRALFSTGIDLRNVFSGTLWTKRSAEACKSNRAAAPSRQGHCQPGRVRPDWRRQYS